MKGADSNLAALGALPLGQLWRDHLIALSVLEPGPGQVDSVLIVVLAPASNPAVTAAEARYRRLLPHALTFERRTLEEVVAVVASVSDARWVRDFRHRYLDPTR